MAQLPVGPSRKFDNAKVTEILAALVFFNGNTAKTTRQLKERGIVIDKRTLQRWRDSQYVDRYQEIAALQARDSQDRLANTWRELEAEAVATSLEAVDKAKEQLRAGDVKDAAKFARELAVVGGVATDKDLLLTGRPTQITETRSPDWYEGKLAELIQGAEVVEDAEEIDP